MTAEGRRATLWACLASLFLLQTAQSFYLPGVAPQDFAKVLPCQVLEELHSIIGPRSCSKLPQNYFLPRFFALASEFLKELFHFIDESVKDIYVFAFSWIYLKVLLIPSEVYEAQAALSAKCHRPSWMSMSKWGSCLHTEAWVNLEVQLSSVRAHSLPQREAMWLCR